MYKSPRPDKDPASAVAETDSGLNLSHILNIVRRNLRFIVLTTGFGAALAVAAGLLLPIHYTSMAQIVIDPEGWPRTIDVPGEQAGDKQIAEQRDEATFDALMVTHELALGSRELLRRVSESLSSATGAAVAPPPPADAEEAPAHIVAQAPAQTGILDEMRHRAQIWIATFKTRPKSRMINLNDPKALKISRERKSKVISITYIASSPELAAAVPNRIAETYVAARNEKKRAKVSEELAQIDERITALRRYADSAAARARGMMYHGERQSSGPDFIEQRMREALGEASSARLLLPNLERRQLYLRTMLANPKADVEIFTRAAAPELPSTLNPILFVIPASMLFFIGAAWIAILRNHLDQGLRSERDIDALGAPFLGAAPELPRNRENRPHQYMLGAPTEGYAEAIRSLMASLKLLGPDAAPQSLLVTSSVPAEGKTTLAVSLAAYLAHLGRRVVLVDLDFRRQGLSELLDLMPNRALELPCSMTTFTEHIQRIPSLEMDCLSVQCRTNEPMAMFANEQLPQLLSELRKIYDFIIVDGPPLLVVTEARLLGRLVDKVVLAVRWGATSRKLVQNALRSLQSFTNASKAQKSFAGVAITRVNLREHVQYGYQDFSDSLVNYGSYYSKPARRLAAPPKPKPVGHQSKPASQS